MEVQEVAQQGHGRLTMERLPVAKLFSIWAEFMVISCLQSVYVVLYLAPTKL